MFSFIHSDKRERAAFVEGAKAELAEKLVDPFVVQSMGEHAIATYLTMTNELYVPNVRNGEINIPASKRTSEATPVWALDSGEKFVVGDSFGHITPGQKRVLEKVIKETDDLGDNSADRLVRDIEKTMESSDGTGHEDIFEDNLGLTLYRGVKVSTSKSRMPFVVLNRPLIILNRTTEVLPSSTLLHEEVLADMQLTIPYNRSSAGIKSSARKDSELLIASHHTSNYIQGLSSSRDPRFGDESIPVRADVDIERVRKLHADPEHPFLPNEAMVKALREINIDYIG